MTNTKKHFYALLIAINDYPITSHRLNGCINDQEAMLKYLSEKCDEERFELKLKVLTNENAIRSAIIEAFDHFSAANNGDVCLLYFSGHGSQMTAPEEFWKVEKDRLLESIVCYDSRLEGGFDLVDKELGYLIWMVTRNKTVHFVAVMDCCHSGTNTRDIDLKCRMVETNRNVRGINDFIGYKSFVPGSQLQIYRGSHVQIAAAKSYQTAKELEINGCVRGIFTYSLLDILSNSNSFISYQELLPRVAAKIYNKVHDQEPLLDFVGENGNSLLVFSGALKPTSQSYLINYDQKLRKWKLHAGALHGIVQSDTDSKTVIKVKELDKTITVQKVYPSYSFLDKFEEGNENLQYEGSISEMASIKLGVAFSTNIVNEAMFELREAYKKRSYLYFKLNIDSDNADYLIHTIAQKGSEAFLLTKKDSNRPVFKRVQQFNSTSATIFLDNIEFVAKWIHVSELNNPRSTIKDTDLEITLLKFEGENKPEVTQWSSPVIFNYKLVAGEWVKPAFQLSIKINLKEYFL
jgi:hypothetical protein